MPDRPAMPRKPSRAPRRSPQAKAGRKRKPSPRHRVPLSPCPPVPPSPTAPLDLVDRAERAALADLLAKVQAGKRLSATAIRDLARLQAKHMGVESLSCAVSISDGRPVVTVPAGHSVAVSTDDQLAEVYGVEDRQVRDWKTDHTWPAGQRGPYQLRAGLPAFVRSKRERPAGPSEMAMAQLEVKKLQAQALQMRLTQQGSKGVTDDVRSAVKMVTTAWINDLKDADETYAGVLTFMLDRMAKRKPELLSVTGG